MSTGKIRDSTSTLSLCNKAILLTWQGMVDCESIFTRARARQIVQLQIVTQAQRVPGLLLIQSRPCSCRGTAMSHELAPLSLSCMVNLSKLRERDASMACLLSFAAIVLSNWCCRFRSSTNCLPSGMKMLCFRIAATCGVVINFEAGYCSDASTFFARGWA